MEEFAYNRRGFIKSSLLTGVGLAGGLWPISASARKPTRLTILHTNDTHSRIDPYPAGGPNAGMGGVLARMRLIESIRSEEEHVLLFDAGDIFQGTPYFNFFKGAVEMKAMQRMGYDAATMGNHDFDEGVENFERQMKHIRFPIVVSNYDFSKTSLAGKIKSYQIFKLGKLKVGVFGLGIDPKGLFQIRCLVKYSILSRWRRQKKWLPSFVLNPAS
jgi:5'-nucleotidase